KPLPAMKWRVQRSLHPQQPPRQPHRLDSGSRLWTKRVCPACRDQPGYLSLHRSKQREHLARLWLCWYQSRRFWRGRRETGGIWHLAYQLVPCHRHKQPDRLLSRLRLYDHSADQRVCTLIGIFSRPLATQLLSFTFHCAFHSIHYRNVSGTAAKISTQSFDDLFIGWVWVVIQHGAG